MRPQPSSPHARLVSKRLTSWRIARPAQQASNPAMASSSWQLWICDVMSTRAAIPHTEGLDPAR
eukprot:9396474-Pyramimonas_sp.AAC.1